MKFISLSKHIIDTTPLTSIGIKNKQKVDSNSNDSNALYEFGLELYNGNNISMNRVESLKYFKLSSEKGNINSLFHLGTMYDLGKDIPVDKAKAIQYYKTAIEKGN